MKRNLFFYAILGGAFLFASCTKDDKTDDKNLDKAKLTIMLTDAPADYEQVLIDLKEVQVNFTEEGKEKEWLTLDGVKAKVYNLLDLTNGVDVLIAEQELPAGTISQIRLILGDKNQVKQDGEYYDLDTPAALQSGLKLNVIANLTKGSNYTLWLDFDAGRSIVAKGNGKYSLKPVIRLFTKDDNSAVKGIVSPAGATPYINIISADKDTFSTFANPETGYFMIKALPVGKYTVEINPKDGYKELEIEDVEVEKGKVSNLGKVLLEEVLD